MYIYIEGERESNHLACGIGSKKLLALVGNNFYPTAAAGVFALNPLRKSVRRLFLFLLLVSKVSLKGGFFSAPVLQLFLRRLR